MKERDLLLSVDIETVPDERLIPADWPADAFPRTIWHRVVAVSYVEARIERGPGGERYVVRSCRSAGTEVSSERELLAAFWEYVERNRPRILTWNGRSFDIPVLKLRAMMHGISCAAWDRSGDRWSGYRNRYSPEWHTDLMDQLCDYGASARPALQDVSVAWGFPGKIGGSGGGVKAMMDAGRLDAVRAYCECDALLTYACFLVWAGHTGLADADGVGHGLADLADHLRAHRAERPHFGEFLDGWRDAPVADVTKPRLPAVVPAMPPALPAPWRPPAIASFRRPSPPVPATGA